MAKFKTSTGMPLWVDPRLGGETITIEPGSEDLELGLPEAPLAPTVDDMPDPVKEPRSRWTSRAATVTLVGADGKEATFDGGDFKLEGIEPPKAKKPKFCTGGFVDATLDMLPMQDHAMSMLSAFLMGRDGFARPDEPPKPAYVGTLGGVPFEFGKTETHADGSATIHGTIVMPPPRGSWADHARYRALPWHKRNPKVQELRWWWVHHLGKSVRSFKRTRLGQVRRRWRASRLMRTGLW